jgi:glycosyltransferase involved in cell wall biosynthesis
MLGLTSGLVELGHEVVIYGYGPQEAARSEISRHPLVRERVLPPPRLRQRGLAVFSRLTELARVLSEDADRLDVLIIHGMFSPDSLSLLRAARQGGIKTIAQPHDPYAQTVFQQRRLGKVLYWNAVERRFLSSVDAIQLYAPSHRHHLARLGINTRTLVVPAAISSEAVERGSCRRRLTGSENGIAKLLFVGRFDIHNKGLDLLFEAIATTPDIRSHVRLECFGARTEDEYDAALKLVRGFGIEDCVRLEYRTDDPWTAYAAVDLFVLPSRFDGFALVVLEALASGTPVVISSAAGAAEYIGDTAAVVVAEPSVEGLRRGLRDAIERKAELKAAAVDSGFRIADELNWVSSAQRWLQAAGSLELVPTNSMGVTR